MAGNKAGVVKLARLGELLNEVDLHEVAFSAEAGQPCIAREEFTLKFFVALGHFGTAHEFVLFDRIYQEAIEKDYSFIAGNTIGELRIAERTGAMILATRNREGTFDTSPSASDRIRAGDTLIVLGTREQISRLEHLMRGEGVSED